MKRSFATALAAAVFAVFAVSLFACAVDEPSPTPGPAPDQEVTSAVERTLQCEPYDPSYCDEATSCEVFSQFVQCASGVYMYAYRTPDCRWCIPRDVCNGNPTVCPF